VLVVKVHLAYPCDRGSFVIGRGAKANAPGSIAFDQNGVPDSIGDTTAAGLRCGK